MGRRLTLVDLPYLQVYESRGKTFAYYRRGGRRIRLQGEIGSPSFLAAYEATRLAFETEPPKRQSKAPPGSFRALIESYKAATEYTELGGETRKAYDRLLAPLVERHGDKPVAKLPRDWVLRRRDELSATPRTANYRIAVLRRVLSFAIDRGWRTDNPAARIKPLKTGSGHRVWSEDEIAAMTGGQVGDVRLPVLLAIHTAQRQADILRLLWSAYDGTAISVRQGKTGAVVTIPLPASVCSELDALPRRAAVICTTEGGRPWKTDWFKHRFAQARADLGLPDDLHFHGLRHSAASQLAEAGATDAEIQAITGHRSRAMVAHYTAGARQKRLAEAAVARLKKG